MHGKGSGYVSKQKIFTLIKKNFCGGFNIVENRPVLNPGRSTGEEVSVLSTSCC